MKIVQAYSREVIIEMSHMRSFRVYQVGEGGKLYQTAKITTQENTISSSNWKFSEVRANHIWGSFRLPKLANLI